MDSYYAVRSGDPAEAHAVMSYICTCTWAYVIGAKGGARSRWRNFLGQAT